MPTPVPLSPTITEAGVQAAFDAHTNGLELELTHIGLGTGLYTPTGTEIALVDEIIRVPIGGGGQIAPTQVQVYALAIASGPTMANWIGEIGIYAGTTLFAVFSRPATPVLYLSDAVYTTINYTLGLSALPSGLVNVMIDPTASANSLILDAHLLDPDPHPQYITEPELLALLNSDAPTIAEVVAIINARLAILNAAYLDVTQQWVKGQHGHVTPLVQSGGVLTPDMAESNNFSVTLAGNWTLANPANLEPGQSGAIVVTQDATGSRALAFGSHYKFAGGTPPILTSAPGAIDHLYYYVEAAGRVMISAAKDIK